MNYTELDAVLTQKQVNYDTTKLADPSRLRERLESMGDTPITFTIGSEKDSFHPDFRHTIQNEVFLNKKNLCNHIKINVHTSSPIKKTHRHEFIEMNYMYRGSCVNHINGKDYPMKTGDIVIFDTQSCHDITEIGEEDILLNIILLPKEAESVLQDLLPGSCEFSGFIFNAAYTFTKEANFLYFQMNENYSFHTTMQNFLMETFLPGSELNTVLINCHLRTLFAILAQECKLRPEHVVMGCPIDSKAASIVRYIRDHCRSSTRESVAEHFGYSTTYISMMLKNYCNQSFIKLRNDFRLDAIEQELHYNDKQPIRTLMEEYGFTNSTYFYKIYKERFGNTPRSI